MLKLNMLFKISLLLLGLGLTNLFAIDVLVAKEKIKYKEQISVKKLTLKKAKKIYRHCVPVSLNDLNKSSYIAKHYISRGSILCTKDIKKYEKSFSYFST